LCNPKEAYLHFKEQNSDKLAGFSRYAELGQKKCVLAEARSMHALCVYTIQQKVKLMISDAKLYDFTEK
jgi:hypothetical protein